MMALVEFDPNVTIGAIAVFVPAMTTVWLQLRTGRKLKTNHGKTIGEHVEEAALEVKALNARLDMLDSRFELHGDQDVSNFARVETAHVVIKAALAELTKRLDRTI